MIHLPKRDNIKPTEIADPLKFYYLPFTRVFFIKRLALVNAMIKGHVYETLLDIGCGSGIFLKELRNRCNKLHAIDVHRKMHFVHEMIKKEDIDANLTEASVLDLPYDSETFDCVISVSVLEHIKELERALKEIHRVAKKDAVIVLAFPVENRITDIILRFAYTLLPNVSLEDEHVSTHRDIIHAADEIFRKGKIQSYPSYIPLDYSSYCVYKTIKRG